MYIVASHGGSPSGRLMAVGGRGSRPERDLGLVAEGVRGEVVVEVVRGFCWVSGVRVLEEIFLVVVGLLLLGRRLLVGDSCDPGREAGVGVLYEASGSSSRT